MENRLFVGYLLRPFNVLSKSIAYPVSMATADNIGIRTNVDHFVITSALSYTYTGVQRTGYNVFALVSARL